MTSLIKSAWDVIALSDDIPNKFIIKNIKSAWDVIAQSDVIPNKFIIKNIKSILNELRK